MFAQTVTKQRLGKHLNGESVFYEVRVANVATQRRGKHICVTVSRHATISVTWDVFCAVGTNQQYSGVLCAVGAEAI
jgi:hypothetical protein